MSVQSGIILNQGNVTGCAVVSMLGALKKMKPEIDEQTILKEVLADKSLHLTYQRAITYFQKKGLAKGIKPVKYSPFRAKKKPLLTGLVGVDWATTGKTHKITFKDNGETNSHFFYIDAPGVIANSWGDKWGDKGYCYFEQSQIRKFKQCFEIII